MGVLRRFIPYKITKIRRLIQIQSILYLHKALCTPNMDLWNDSIFLHSGLKTAWHFCLSTRFSCCLKNILGYIRGQFYRFSGKYPKMFKTDFIFRQQKIEFKPECQACSCYYATGCFLAFLKSEMRPKYDELILFSSSIAF